MPDQSCELATKKLLSPGSRSRCPYASCPRLLVSLWHLDQWAVCVLWGDGSEPCRHVWWILLSAITTSVICEVSKMSNATHTHVIRGWNSGNPFSVPVCAKPRLPCCSVLTMLSWPINVMTTPPPSTRSTLPVYRDNAPCWGDWLSWSIIVWNREYHFWVLIFFRMELECRLDMSVAAYATGLFLLHQPGWLCAKNLESILDFARGAVSSY